MHHFRSKWRKCQNSIARPQAVHSKQSEFKQAVGLPVVPQERLQAEVRVLVKTDTQKKKKKARPPGFEHQTPGLRGERSTYWAIQAVAGQSKSVYYKASNVRGFSSPYSVMTVSTTTDDTGSTRERRAHHILAFHVQICDTATDRTAVAARHE